MTRNLSAIAYWITTVIIATESLVGGIWDVLRTDYIREVLEQQLGYPPYVAVILGLWKIPGAMVLLIPRFPRLKEWVYAGVMFVYTGAAASHFLVGDIGAGIGPLGFAAITMISWALRPSSRRDPAPYTSPFADARRRTIAYWVTTLAFAVALFTGGWPTSRIAGKPWTACWRWDIRRTSCTSSGSGRCCRSPPCFRAGSPG